MFEENYRKRKKSKWYKQKCQVNCKCEPQENKIKEEKPAMVFQLTAICESSGSVSSQHPT
jgi:hypothetical protein